MEILVQIGHDQREREETRGEKEEIGIETPKIAIKNKESTFIIILDECKPNIIIQIIEKVHKIRWARHPNTREGQISRQAIKIRISKKANKAMEWSKSVIWQIFSRVRGITEKIRNKNWSEELIENRSKEWGEERMII